MSFEVPEGSTPKYLCCQLLKGGLHDAFCHFILYYNFLTNSLKVTSSEREFHKEDNGDIDFSPKTHYF